MAGSFERVGLNTRLTLRLSLPFVQTGEAESQYSTGPIGILDLHCGVLDFL